MGEGLLGRQDVARKLFSLQCKSTTLVPRAFRVLTKTHTFCLHFDPFPRVFFRSHIFASRLREFFLHMLLVGKYVDNTPTWDAPETHSSDTWKIYTKNHSFSEDSMHQIALFHMLYIAFHQMSLGCVKCHGDLGIERGGVGPPVESTG